MLYFIWVVLVLREFIMELSGTVGRALVWYSHTAISEICFHALCHLGGISLA